VRIEFDLTRVDPALGVGLSLTKSDGTVVLISYQTDAAPDLWPDLRVGRNSIACTIPGDLLNEGLHLVAPRVCIHGQRWILRDAASVAFEVHHSPGESPYLLGTRQGAIAPVLVWRRLP